jgi:hypothetical protein
MRKEVCVLVSPRRERSRVIGEVQVGARGRDGHLPAHHPGGTKILARHSAYPTKTAQAEIACTNAGNTIAHTSVSVVA